jgi:DNA uptake protein ComE-like DNA-binding protein
MIRLLRNALVALSVTALVACGGDAEQTDADRAAVDTTMAPETGAPATAAPGQAGQGLVNPETASREELAAVQGLNPGLADSIIAARPIEDMTEVDAILAGSMDETQREEVYRHLWKPIDLNTASDEEILLIPNIGDRMLHEFKEYRPYSAIEQFRREMGKYVDDAEVARMEQYVEVR